MKNRSIGLIAACAILGACGGDEPPPEPPLEEKVAQEMAAGPETIEGALQELVKGFGGESVETVSIKVLRDMLPEKLAGMKRTSIEASKNGAMGITISSANADYVGLDPEKYQTLSINIQDLGSAQAMVSMGLKWLNSETYNETEDGFERTAEYKGHKAFESFNDNGASARSNKMVFVGGRFLIDLTGKNVPFEMLDDVLDTLPFDELSKLAKN